MASLSNNNLELLQKELAKNQNIPGKEIGFPGNERHIDYMA